MPEKIAALYASDAPPRIKPSNYPEPFASLMAGRVKRPLGDLFGLSNFGVNLTSLSPGSVSALHHRHSRQDEFIYVINGEPTLLTDEGEIQLKPGMVAGFAASGTAHHLENRTDKTCVVLEVGDRSVGDEVSYPSDDIAAVRGDDGKWHFTHQDGTPY
ncbi:cupin domain-containing protein [Sodalis sp. RH15]|uniref:cupin domain-containing protein n=1 Tax=Sodalis sp. RH15 TaxID=3394330 RepID=UPI0039B56F6B